MTLPFHPLPAPPATPSGPMAGRSTRPSAVARRPWRAHTLALALALLAGGAAAQAPAEGPATPAATTAPAAAPVLHLEQGERLQGVRRVALPAFQVYVLQEFSAGATAQGASHRSTLASVHTHLKVTGLDNARLRALADRLHDDTVRQLRAAGIEVVPQAQLQALPAWGALQAAADPDGLAIDTAGGKGQVFGARGLPVLHLDEMAWLHRSSGGLFGGPKVEDPFVALGDKMSVGFRLGTLKPALQALATAAGAPLLQVRLVFTAAQLKAQGNSFFSQSAGTTARASLVLPAFTNRFLLMTPDGDFARISLQEPLVAPEPLGELRDVTTTGQTAANVAVTAFTMLAAMGGTGRGVIQNNQSVELATSADIFDAVAAPQAASLVAALTRALATGKP